MGEKSLLQLNELEEIRSNTYESSRVYNARMKRWHDDHIHRREFRVGNLVILFD